MKKLYFLLILFILFGASCKRDVAIVLDSPEIIPTLEKTAETLNWSGSVMSKNPSSENNYGKSYLLNGPSRESKDHLSVDFSSLEILEYGTNESAKYSFYKNECFKGKGIPIKIGGDSVCCLNNIQDGWSSTVMLSGHYILRAVDYFHTDCYAKKYLEEFFKNYID
ncbi:MAG: hypothetical protein COU51_03000 [Parcubacteria group bacterium CG10_big_fil_rev_8_21_14_0_10_36_14]|nr:MAG: hypothetical protein COU51_03000 [Parcubacteria group bacterium CG10_big_fil_rev_8_21_14_0_10_36_14]